ncbi:uncharacterized protein LOC141590162 [Silene latifolia]|uniref:uncharacterized protein LOC141590162 n=1 Tax=Silene latifolia TaxID=37657 RepID=UPI003D788327
MCEGAIPNGVTEDQFKLRAFPFSLMDAAKDWLFYLTPGSISTWKELKAIFLEKFYPDSRHNRAKKAITTIEQDGGETMYEYWERFKRLVAQCPYHGLSGDDLLVNFYEGLGQEDQRMVNSATGGGLENYSITDAKKIIERLVSTTRNYGRIQRGSRNVSSMETTSSSTQNLEQSVNDLTHLVKNMMGNTPNKEGSQRNRVECNYCQGPHLEEACPIMIEEGIGVENVSAMGYGNYNARNPSRGGYYNYDPNGNTYNVRSRDNSRLGWGGDTSKSFVNGQFNHLRDQNSNPPRDQNFRQGQASKFQGNRNGNSNNQGRNQNHGQSSQFGNQCNNTNSQKEPSVQDFLKNILQEQVKTNKRFDKIDADKGVSDAKKKRRAKSHERIIHIEEKIEEELVVEKEKETPSKANGEEEKSPLSKDKAKQGSNNTKAQIEEIEREYVVEVPFPNALTHSKRVERDEDLYETFRKCEVNIPLLNLLKGVPRYAKFLKELYTPRRSPRKGTQRVRVSEHVSAIFKKSLPKKCGDPGIFTIPCSIGDKSFTHAMLDLGASINVMPYALYETLGLPPLNKTDVVIQLADRSSIYTKGMVEDVLVEVDHLTFLADFYVLDMEADSRATPILLGRPFMKTSKTKIDVSNGNLTMEFDGKKLTYNIYDAMKHPDDKHSCYFLNIIEPIVHQVYNLYQRDPLEVTLTNNVEQEGLRVVLPNDVQDYVNKLEEEITFEDDQMEKREVEIRDFGRLPNTTAVCHRSLPVPRQSATSPVPRVLVFLKEKS